MDGAGLGLRREILGAQQDLPAGAVDFMELAPENWIGVGGRLGRILRTFTERHPFVAHGLSLSLGGPAPFDPAYLRDIRGFLDAHSIRCYSEHLSWCADDRGQLYDLMPLPFTEEAVAHVVARIQQVQDAIGRRMAIEHVSYYAAPGQQMGELAFINAVLEAADCELLLDVNNVFVNSVNFGYDPVAFIDGLPLDRVAYVHIAGHYDEAPGLKIDTHGSAVIEPVWDLLAHLYRRAGPLPTLLERDFNFPPMDQLLGEVQQIRSLQAQAPAARRAG